MRARSLILNTIRTCGTTSQSELIDLTELTGATVSTNVRALIDEGFVAEVGTAASTGGKRRRMVRLVGGARYAVGVHLDRSVSQVVLVNLAGDVVATVGGAGMAIGQADESIDRIAAQIEALIAQAGIDRARVLGIGVCLPGPMTQQGAEKALVPAFIAQWANIPLAELLRRATGLAVVVDNDATACALGEYWINPKGSQSMATLYMGSGLGGAAIIDGIPYRGVTGNSIEVGHICVDVNGPACWCGSRGCIGEIAGPPTVNRKAQEAGLLGPDDGTSTLDRYCRVAELAHAGNERALAIFADSARYVALAAHVLATILDPDHIALTGAGFVAAGDLYAPAIERMLNTVYVARTIHTIGVSVSRRTDDTAAMGAAVLIFQSALLFDQLADGRHP
jgi:predicted NBD/HSP70 family sugar kinase